MNGLKLFILTVVLFLYLLLGAVIFHYLEYDNETVNRSGLRLLRDQLLANFTCLTEEAISDFVRALSESGDIASLVTNATSLSSNWDFSSAFFFSGTVVTTIGYGNISPITRGGQSFAIVYAIVGIPLCGLVLAQLGTRLNARTQKLEDRFTQALERHDKPAWLAKLANILVLVLILLFFLIIPAVIFMVIEGWGYQEAWYYCFVTLTTIGFGDYVVGTNPDIRYTWVYKWLVYVWIFFGLVNMATIITKITDWMSEKAENSKIGGRPSNKEGEPALSPESSSDDRTKEEKGGEDVEMTKVNGAEI